MATIKELADQVYAQFEQRTRDNGRKFWVLKDGKPDWMQELCHEAHGDMMPDDWKYEFVLEAVAALSDADDPDDVQLEADIYNSDLLQWLASHLERAGYVDEAVDYGIDSKDFDIMQCIALGQLREKEEVLSIVRSYLERKADEEEGNNMTKHTERVGEIRFIHFGDGKEYHFDSAANGSPIVAAA